MNYPQRWLLAVALKRPYPTLETGAEESVTSPPEFTAAELSPAIVEERQRAKRNAFWGGLALGAIGAVLVDRLLIHTPRTAP